MLRWLKIPEDIRPEIVSDISDGKFFTLVVHNWDYRKVSRKHNTIVLAARTANNIAINGSDGSLTRDSTHAASRAAWEGYCEHESQVFKNVINDNIPCLMIHKVKNHWCSEIDTLVCFMTGDTRDVFLVHPKDLMKWDPNEIL